MSSHPGCTMDDAARLAVYTKRIGLDPEQVQDFYPTPGTASTVMYYTGLDPFTGKEVYTATDYHEKQLQRALLQWRRPENRRKIREAMDYCSPAGIRDLEELLSGSPGIHRAPEKPEEPESRGKSGGKKPGRPGENHPERSGRNSGGRKSDPRPSGKPENPPRRGDAKQSGRKTVSEPNRRPQKRNPPGKPKNPKR